MREYEVEEYKAIIFLKRNLTLDETDLMINGLSPLFFTLTLQVT